MIPKLKELLIEAEKTTFGSFIGTKNEGKNFASASKIKQIVFHFTSAKEKVLKTGFRPKAGGGYGAGIYFSTSKTLFKGYGGKRLDCFVNIQNPFKIKDKESESKYRKYFSNVVKIYGKDFDKVWDEIRT